MTLSVSWCADPAESEELGLFFTSNLTPDYISHSELQGPRALDESTWAPDLPQTIIAEIRERVQSTKGHVPAGVGSAPIAAARKNGILVGVAMVSFFHDAKVPFAVIEDIVVGNAYRNQGIGGEMLHWITDEALRVGCARAFLESGVRNASAHEFFEREGFDICSVVMMKPLGTAEPKRAQRIVAPLGYRA